MNRKEELKKELEAIEEAERIEKEKKIEAELKAQRRGIVLKRARCRYNLYYCSEYTFKEISDGFYRVGEILGLPEFKKDDILVFVQDKCGDFYWVKWNESRENYLDCDGDYKMTSKEADGYIDIFASGCEKI